MAGTGYTSGKTDSIGLSQLVTAIQTNLPPEDASLGSSYVSFAQYFGGAVFAAAAKTAFTEAVGPALHEYAPGVSPSALKGAGVTDVRHDIPADLVRGVILAYNKAITHVFVSVCISALSFMFLANWSDTWIFNLSMYN